MVVSPPGGSMKSHKGKNFRGKKNPTPTDSWLLSNVSELLSIFSVAIAGLSIKGGKAFYWGDSASRVLRPMLLAFLLL